MERFGRLSRIVEETIGLSAMGLKALIKRQVIFQQWLECLNRPLENTPLIFGTRWYSRH